MSPPEEVYFGYARKCRIKRPSEAADEYIAILIHQFEQLLKCIELGLASRNEMVPQGMKPAASSDELERSERSLPPLMRPGGGSSWYTAVTLS
jgi:hypothetical protein